MKIAFVGKGGSGKTTLSSLFIRHLVAHRAPVVAVDADINQHLGAALGLAEETSAALPALGAHLPLIKEYLRGSNPRIASAETMIKTTPPGAGSRLLRVREENPVYAACGRSVALDGGSALLMATGPFTESDLGVACYHSKVGAVELCLNHLVDGAGEYVVVDMTAGSDSFASGMFTRFDVTFLVAEPTRKGVSVYRQYKEYARDFGVALKVVGNKVQGEDDLEFLRAEIGEDLLVTVGQSDWVRAMEKGRPAPFSELEPGTGRALELLRETVDGAYARRDWRRYTEQMVHFHRRNAESWGNAKTGTDLADQIDPGFVLCEEPAEPGPLSPPRSAARPSPQPA
ncbi:ATP-binding protein [Streptomyces sp. NPDC097619]|uniref:ATP-binding protein n=1 Tax=Streptomyces sp. NPDC097619 TaxID=3157228 RepID=UPI00332B201C